MRKNNFNKKLFWYIFIPTMLVNLLPVYIFRDKAKLSEASFFAILTVAFVLIYGALACGSKDASHFIIKKYHYSRFWRYNKPTAADRKAFWLHATIYFLPVPFYIPIIFFSTSIAHSLWSLFLLLLPQFTFIGIDIGKVLHDVKNEKLRQERLEKERIEQERREELGKWK